VKNAVSRHSTNRHLTSPNVIYSTLGDEPAVRSIDGGWAVCHRSVAVADLTDDCADSWWNKIGNCDLLVSVGTAALACLSSSPTIHASVVCSYVIRLACSEHRMCMYVCMCVHPQSAAILLSDVIRTTPAPSRFVRTAAASFAHADTAQDARGFVRQQHQQQLPDSAPASAALR
jgi:hypothetical protein